MKFKLQGSAKATPIDVRVIVIWEEKRDYFVKAEQRVKLNGKFDTIFRKHINFVLLKSWIK